MMNIEIYGESLLGTREEQQDSFLYKITEDIVIAVVCDGMGGLNGGAKASKIAAQTFKEDVQNAMPIANYTSFLREEAVRLDRLIFYLEDTAGEWLRAGTTIVAVLIVGNLLFFLTVGDSKLFMQRGQGMVPINREHNYQLQLEDYRKRGVITEEEYKSEMCRQGEALISYLGVGDIAVMDVNRKPIPLHVGDRILLCSDGLTKMFNDKEIKSFFVNDKDIKHICSTIKGTIKKRQLASWDNTTYVVIEVNEGGYDGEL